MPTQLPLATNHAYYLGVSFYALYLRDLDHSSNPGPYCIFYFRILQGNLAMSSRFTDTLKRGWHPEKEGTTFKGQMVGAHEHRPYRQIRRLTCQPRKALLVEARKYGATIVCDVQIVCSRRMQDDNRNADRVARPISSLRDPASFGPPPKHIAAGGSMATPVPTTRPAQDSTITPASPSRAPYRPATVTDQQEVPEEEAPKPPQPYRVDTTGLSTSHLPPPPLRRDGADGRSPPPAAAAARLAPPSLPPRLPPRGLQGSSSIGAATSSPDARQRSDYLNEGAANRLGAAGISVPGLGINKPAPSATPASPSTASRSAAFVNGSQLNELQSRFACLGSSGSAAGPNARETPSEGTTFAQKQAALQTASNFRKDPGSVSVSDARAAASTINNFRQRHGDQIAAGSRQASALNDKYGIVGRAGGQVDGGETTASTGNVGANQSTPVSSSASAIAATSAILGKKKPAPPPPAKKPALAHLSQDAPPPIPLNTRPQF
jgi:hypothetical protein